MAFGRSAGQNWSMNCAGVWPSLAISGSSGIASPLIAYSRMKLALMITAAGGSPGLDRGARLEVGVVVAAGIDGGDVDVRMCCC